LADYHRRHRFHWVLQTIQRLIEVFYASPPARATVDDLVRDVDAERLQLPADLFGHVRLGRRTLQAFGHKRVAEGPAVPSKPGNAGGGKERTFFPTFSLSAAGQLPFGEVF
jgi:hypothetical protein